MRRLICAFVVRKQQRVYRDEAHMMLKPRPWFTACPVCLILLNVVSQRIQELLGAFLIYNEQEKVSIICMMIG